MKKIFFKIYSFIQSLLRFKSFGNNSLIKWPFKIWNKSCIEIGKDVFVAENSFFSVSKIFNKEPTLKIGDGVCIGSNFFVACIDEVIIENDVLLSDRVFISDHIHDYHDISQPVISQPLLPRGPVRIKSGAFIGINSVIMPGVTIGHNSIIGASSVVTSDVPDYCVVAGNPANVLRKYNFNKKEWEKV